MNLILTIKYKIILKMQNINLCLNDTKYTF